MAAAVTSIEKARPLEWMRANRAGNYYVVYDPFRIASVRIVIAARGNAAAVLARDATRVIVAGRRLTPRLLDDEESTENNCAEIIAMRFHFRGNHLVVRLRGLRG